MKMNEPLWNPKKTKTYYRAQLRKSFNVIKYHIEFFTYCHLGQSYLDEQYFSRTNNRFKSQEIDSKFSTGYDSILAIILANKMLKDYVENLISTQGPDCRGNSGITWTAKKAYLVELIYALHKAEAFNNGNAELKQIATLFENHFNVTLGNFYRHFQEIGIRKSGRTTFIDLLKKKLEQRFDEDI
jgi:hypothetical protein